MIWEKSDIYWVIISHNFLITTHSPQVKYKSNITSNPSILYQIKKMTSNFIWLSRWLGEGDSLQWWWEDVCEGYRSWIWLDMLQLQLQIQWDIQDDAQCHVHIWSHWEYRNPPGFGMLNYASRKQYKILHLIFMSLLVSFAGFGLLKNLFYDFTSRLCNNLR